MKLIFMTLFILSIFTIQTSIVYAKEPSPVKNVDAKKFSGLWYEIARTYNSFEKDCVASTVKYKFINPLEYEIKNRCFDTEIGGRVIEYNGTAQASNGKVMSEIDMTYFWIFTKRYKIIFLSDDYSSAVVVDDDFEYVWIMNREPFMEKNKLNKIVTLLSKYMDVSELIYTPQDAQGRYK